jgi:hypothetical protein
MEAPGPEGPVSHDHISSLTILDHMKPSYSPREPKAMAEPSSPNTQNQKGQLCPLLAGTT